MEEIMNNEVREEAVEVVTTNPVNGFKVAVGIGVVALVGLGTYKLGKKIYTKIKARKGKSETIETRYDEFEVDEVNSEYAE